jgi:hypothetical protein
MTCAHTKRPLHRDHLIYCASITALWQLPAETSSSDAWQSPWEMAAEFCLRCISFTLVGFFTMPYILRNGTDGFTNAPKKVVQRVCIFIYLQFILRSYFRNYDFTSSNERVMSELWIGKDFDGNGRGLIWSYYAGTCLEGLRGTTKNLSQDSQSPGWSYGLRSPLKTHGPRPGLNPRNLGPIARTLPLNHRGRLLTSYSTVSNFSGCSLLVTAEAYVIIL